MLLRAHDDRSKAFSMPRQLANHGCHLDRFGPRSNDGDNRLPMRHPSVPPSCKHRRRRRRAIHDPASSATLGDEGSALGLRKCSLMQNVYHATLDPRHESQPAALGLRDTAPGASRSRALPQPRPTEEHPRAPGVNPGAPQSPPAWRMHLCTSPVASCWLRRAGRHRRPRHDDWPRGSTNPGDHVVIATSRMRSFLPTVVFPRTPA